MYIIEFTVIWLLFNQSGQLLLLTQDILKYTRLVLKQNYKNVPIPQSPILANVIVIFVVHGSKYIRQNRLADHKIGSA